MDGVVVMIVVALRLFIHLAIKLNLKENASYL